jgi:TonB family protein
MRKFIGAVLAACFLTGAGQVLGQSSPPRPVRPGERIVQVVPKWLRFTSVTAGFNILTPRRMAKKAEDVAPGMRVTMFQTRAAGVTYFVGYTDYPEFFVLEKQLPGLFDNGAVAATKRMDGKILGKRDFKVDGKSGRETRIVSGDKKTLLVHQAIVAGSRMYQLYVETTPDGADDPDIRKFLDSFRLGLPEGKSESVKAPTTSTGTGGKSEPPSGSTGGVPVDEFYTEGESASVASPEIKADDARVPPPQDAATVTPSGPVRRSEGALRKEAVNRAVPKYPRDALAQRLSGDVQVEILIDETGKVVEARVLGGPREFHSSSLNAAYQWTFKPFLLNGTAVKVIGVPTFRFSVSG